MQNQNKVWFLLLQFVLNRIWLVGANLCLSDRSWICVCQGQRMCVGLPSKSVPGTPLVIYRNPSMALIFFSGNVLRYLHQANRLASGWQREQSQVRSIDLLTRGCPRGHRKWTELSRRPGFNPSSHNIEMKCRVWGGGTEPDTIIARSCTTTYINK